LPGKKRGEVGKQGNRESIFAKKGRTRGRRKKIYSQRRGGKGQRTYSKMAGHG